jgi:hypothetical protein
MYFESSDLIISNASKQFTTRESKQYAINMNIKMKIVSIESHHSIKMIERYYNSLYRVYVIIVFEIFDINSNSTLQMTFKTLNDSIDLNDLIFILLVFDAYSRMIKMNVSFSTITQRSIAMRKAMKKVCKTIAFR